MCELEAAATNAADAMNRVPTMVTPLPRLYVHEDNGNNKYDEIRLFQIILFHLYP